jgi:hypothetical protein
MGKNKGKIAIKGFIGESQSSILSETVPVQFLEKRVRFSLRDCDINKFCIRKLTDNEIKRFYKRLGYFEEFTWQQIRQLAREDGFSLEKKESSNHSYLSRLYSQFSQFYHFRVNGVQTPFRVFGAQKDDLCYLLLVDKDGCINHN